MANDLHYDSYSCLFIVLLKHIHLFLLSGIVFYSLTRKYFSLLVSCPLLINNIKHQKLSREEVCLIHISRGFSLPLAGSSAGRSWQKGIAEQNYSFLGDQEAEQGNSTRKEGTRVQLYSLLRHNQNCALIIPQVTIKAIKLTIQLNCHT